MSTIVGLVLSEFNLFSYIYLYRLQELASIVCGQMLKLYVFVGSHKTIFHNNSYYTEG